MSLSRTIRRLRKKEEARAARKAKRGLIFEPLEPRILLSADMSFAMTGLAKDLSLGIHQVDGVDMIQLVNNDAADPAESVVASRALSETSSVEVIGSDQDDVLRLDFDFSGLMDSLSIFFEGGGGNDALFGPSVDTSWNITGQDTGLVAGVHFASVENLIGAADNEDTFIFNEGGALSGLMDGGEGGFDSIMLDGGTFDSLIYRAFGPDSGTIERDGDVIMYSGMEPIWITSGTADVTVDLSSVSDDAVMTQSGSSITIASSSATFESVTFSVPGVSLTINLGDDDGVFPNLDDYVGDASLDLGFLDPIAFIQGDILTVQGTVNLGSASFTVNGEDGLDYVIFDGALTAGAIDIEAEQITVESGASVTGSSVEFNAEGTDNGLIPTELTDGVILAVPHAEIKVLGSITASTGDIVLSATAETNVTASNFELGPIGGALVVALPRATVTIGNPDDDTVGGTLTASGAVNIDTLVDFTITAADAAESDDNQNDVDAAIAITTIFTDSKVGVFGTSSINADGAVSLDAATAMDVTSEADGSGGTAGATVAVSVVGADTGVYFTDTASIGGNTKANAASIALGAVLTANVTTTATSTAGGATASSGGDNESEQQLADNNAETSDGAVSFAGAVVVSIYTPTSEVVLNSDGTVKTDGDVTLNATATESITASASGVNTGGSSTGVGVAVAIGVVDSKVSARLGGATQYTADNVNASATLNAGATYELTAVSGAGNSSETSTAGAGGLAIHVVTTHVEALIENGAALQLNSADLSLTASSTTNAATSAKPTEEGGGGGSELGIGISVALYVGSHNTTAALEGNALADANYSSPATAGINDLTLSATGDHEDTTTAEGGSSGDGTVIGGAVAVAVVDNVTRTDLGDAGALTAAGVVDAESMHSGQSEITADGTALGGDTGIGAAIALGFVDNKATSTARRNLTAPTVSLASAGDGKSVVTAKASAKGEDSGAASDADSQKDAQTGFANSKSGKSDSSPQGATTDSGSVSVAAALALNVSSSLVEASVSGAVTINGDVSLTSSNNMDAKAEADGSASTGDGTGVGVAVAINVADMDNLAVLGSGATVNGGVTASATMKDVSGDTSHDFDAMATSGASASDTGVAGSFALTYVDSDTRAVIEGGATIAAGTDDVSLTAVSTSTSDVEAKANATGDTGAGLSFAINITDQLAEAVVADDAVLTGGADLTLSATGSHVNTTVAQGGGQSKDATGIGGAVAISVADHLTEAMVGTGAAVGLSGALSATTTHHGSTTTTADGTATGGTAVGASIAIAFVDDTAEATIARGVTADGSISLAAHGDGSSIVTAKASASGESSGGTADGQKDAKTGLANTKSGKTKGTDQSASSDGGSVSVAAALALNVSDSTARAVIGDGLTVTAGNGGTGDLSLLASNNMDAKAIADGSAKTTSGGTAVGVAVSINVAGMINEAIVGAGTTVTADGLTLGATMKNVGGNTEHNFEAKSTSGASGGDIGVAGSFALTIAHTNTSAMFGKGAAVSNLTLDGGPVSMTAVNTTTSDVTAEASGSGGGSSMGVGASIALNITFNDTEAGIDDSESNDTVNGTAASLDASSTSNATINTTAKAGAAGGTSIGGAVAVMYVENVTDAMIGAGAGTFALNGALGVKAAHTAAVNTLADGEAAGDNVGVGVSIAINIGSSETNARLSRDIGGTPTTIDILTQSTLSSIAESKASAKGGSSSNDSDSDTETSNKTSLAQTKGGGTKAPTQSGSSAVGTANTNSNTQSGQGTGSGGTSVAATIAVNYLDGDADARISDGVEIDASGAVKVETTHRTTAHAIATATSTNTDADTGVAAAVGVNIVVIDATAAIGANADVSGSSVSVKSLMPTDTKNSYKVRALSGAASKDTAVGGSIGVNYVDTSARAEVGHSATVTGETGDVRIEATNLNEIQNVTGGAALSTGGTGVGLAVSVNVVNTLEAKASVGNNATIDAAGTATVKAKSSLVPLAEDLPVIGKVGVTSFAAGIAVGLGSSGAGAGGSSSVNVIFIDTTASVGTGTTIQGDDGVVIRAEDTLTVFSGAGGLGFSTGNAGIGIGFDVNVIDRDTYATVGALADLGSTDGDIRVEAVSDDDVTSIAATFGLSATGSAGVAASIGVVVLTTDTQATVTSGTDSDNRTRLDAAGDVIVDAQGDAKVFMIAGGLAYGSDAGIGIASTVFVHTDSVIASIGDWGGVTTGGTEGLIVEATSVDDILLIAAAGGVSGGSVGVGGSVIVSVMTETTRATIGSSAAVTAEDGSGARVYAESDTDILAVAGAIGAAAGSAGIGAGVNVHTLTKTTEAHIDSNASVQAEGNVTVEAVSDEVMKTFSLAAGAGSSVGVGISADVYVFDLTTRAYIGDSATVRTEGSVLVQAIDETEADLIVGGASVGGTGGVSAAVGVAVFDKVVDAYIGQNASVTGEGHDTVSARTGRFIIDTTGGNTKEGVNEDDLVLDGGKPTADGLEVGTPVGVGITDKDADNDGTDDMADDPGMSAERTATADTNDTFRGVAVSASSKDDVETMSFSLAIGGTFGVGVAAAVNVVDVDTTATIGQGARINQNVTGDADGAQCVLVAAASDFNHVGIGVGAAGGGTAGVAPGVDVSVVELTTKAQIGANTTVYARNDVAVIATAKEKFLIIGAGIAAAGTFALGGGVSVVTVNDTTLASIGDGASVEAGGDVAVLASDDSSLTIVTGGVGIGIGGAGIGASVGIGLFDKTTDALIGANASIDAKGTGDLGYDGILTGETRITDGSFVRTGDTSPSTPAAHGVIVQADSSESFTNISFAGAGGVYAGIAGAIGVTVIDSDTTAQIGVNAQINQGSGDYAVSANGVDADQGVWVGASNRVSLDQFTIGAAGGFVGIAGAISIGRIVNDVNATIGAGADVRAKSAVEVNALSDKSLTGFTLSGAGGAVGLGASVSVYSLGSSFDATYTDNDSNSDNALEGDGSGDGENTATGEANKQATNSSGQVGSSLGEIQDEDPGAAPGTSTKDSRANTGIGLAQAKLTAGQTTTSSKLGLLSASAVQPGVIAKVEAGGTIVTGGRVDVSAHEAIDAKMNSGQFAAGVAGVGASVSILNLSSNVRASLGGSVNAAGPVAVKANGERVADMLTVGVQAGFVGVGAAVTILNDSSAQGAEVLSSASIDRASSILVKATNDQDLTADTYTLQGGVVAVGVNFTRMSSDDGNAGTLDTFATIGNDARIGQSEAVGTVTVEADSTIDAYAETIGVSVGLAAGGFNFTFIDVTPQVKASIGNNVEMDTTGLVALRATTNHDANARLLGVNAGALGVGVSLASATIGTSVTASIGSGFDASIGGLELLASHNWGTTDRGAHAYAVSAGGGIVSGQGAVPTANANATVSATIGSGGEIDVTGGNISVNSRLRNFAEADALAVSIGVAGVGASISHANANGSATADVNGNITGGNNVVVKTQGENQARAQADAATGGLVAVTVPIASAVASPTLTARLDGNAAVDGDIVVEVDSKGRTDAKTVSVSGSLAGVGSMKTESTVSPTIVAAVGAGMISANSLTVTSRHNYGTDKNQYRARAYTKAAAVSGLAIQVNESRAYANADLHSYIDSGAHITTTSGVTITSAGVNRANAHTDGLNVGILVAVGVTDSFAYANGVSKAGIRDSGALSATPDLDVGGLTITATSQDSANAKVDAAGGGVVNAAVNNSEAKASPTVESYIGQKTSILATGNISLTASADPEADAYTKGSGGGVVSVTSSDAVVEVKPNVTAKIRSGSVIATTGMVKVDASAVPQSGTTPTYLISSPSTTNETVTVSSHGLETGDTIEYYAAGAPIGTLDGAGDYDGTGDNVDRTYNVIRVSEDLLAFGNAFDGASIDNNTEIITFNGAHNFLSGDQVVYRKSGGTTTDIDGLTDGTTYWVLVIDDLSIKLVDSHAKAVNPDSAFKSFTPNDVSGQWIDVGSDHGFTVGDAVTYEAPEAQLFFSAQVDVPDEEEDGKVVLTDTDTDYIRFAVQEEGSTEGDPLAHGFSDNEAVVYTTEVTFEKQIVDGPNPSFSATAKFIDNGTADQIILQSGTWETYGYVAGDQITVSGTPDGVNDGTYTIEVVSGGTLTLNSSASLVTSADIVSVAANFDGNTYNAKFVDAGILDQIILDSGNWSDYGYADGGQIVVTGTTDNNGTYTILTVSGDTLTLNSWAELTTTLGTPYSVTADFNGTQKKFETTVATSTPIGGLVSGHTYYVKTTVDNSILQLKAGEAFSGSAKFINNSGTADQIVLQSGTWAEHGYEIGEKITVDAAGTANDGTYTIAGISGATLTVSASDSLTSTVDGDDNPIFVSASFDSPPLELDPDKTDSSKHYLARAKNAALGGLNDGWSYYVAETTTTQVKLASDKSDLSGTIITPTLPTASGPYANHRIGELAVDITKSYSDWDYELRIDITESIVTGQQKIFGPGHVDLSVVAPQTGDGVSSVYSKGSSGGFIVADGKKGNYGKITVNPTVVADISAALVNAGGNIEITSLADTNGDEKPAVSGYASNGSGGFVAVGGASLDADQTLSSKALIGSGTQMISGGDLLVSSEVDAGTSLSSRSRTGGFVGVASAESHVDVDLHSEVSIGSNATVLVGNLARFTTTGRAVGSSKADARGSGFGGDGDATAHYNINDSESEVKVGSGAIIEANELLIEAYTKGTSILVDTDGRGAGFYAESSADSDAKLDADSLVQINANAKLTGWEGVDLIAVNRNNTISTESFSRSSGLFGHVNADAHSQAIQNADVNGVAAALVTAGPRDPASTNLSHYNYAEEPPGTEERLAFYVEVDNRSISTPHDADVSKRSLAGGNDDDDYQTRTFSEQIDFDSDVLILSGRSPELVTKTLTVSPTAEIEKAVNVWVNDSIGGGEGGNAINSGEVTADKIYVNDITNPGPGDVAFVGANIIGGDGTEAGSGTWTFRETLQRIEILNKSDKDIQINGIDVTADRQPLVTFNPFSGSGAANRTITFNIEHDVAPTLIEITNTGTGDIELNGFINNPIGVTSIVNTQGSVEATQARPTSLVRSHTLNIDAAKNVGSETYRVVTDIVDADGVPESFEFKTGQVSGITEGIFVGLGARFFTGQLVRYHADSTVIGGLVQNGYYYVTMSDDSQSLTLSSTEGGTAINLTPSGDLTNKHTLTGVETYTVDAADDIFLDIRALQRLDLTDTYLINIDRIAAGDDVDVLLRPSYEQTGEGLSGGVRVKYTSNLDNVFHTFFDTPLNQAAVGVSRGVYATGTTEVDSTYDFRGINPAKTTEVRELAGLVSGLETINGDIKVVAEKTGENDTRINILGISEVTRSGDELGEGHITVLTNGWIALTEKTGDMRVESITSTFNDVLLYSPMRILDADGDVNTESDVAGVNITMIAASSFVNPDADEVKGTTGQVEVPTLSFGGLTPGGIGTPVNFLEINVDRNDRSEGVLRAYDMAPENDTDGIFIDEIDADLRIHTVQTSDDVSLRTKNGSIIDARDDDDANIIGLSVDLDANGEGANIGEDSNDLEIDSRAGMVQNDDLDAKTDDVALEATNNIWLAETDNELRLVFAHTYDGNIRLTVREDGTDSNSTAENLQLIDSGSARFAENNSTPSGSNPDADRLFAHGSIYAETGSVELRVADDVFIDANAEIIAGKGIILRGDYNALSPATDADPDYGTRMTLRGKIIAGAELVTAGKKTGADPVGVSRPKGLTDGSGPEVVTGEGDTGYEDRLTRIFGNSDADVITFGDPSGSAGGTNVRLA